LVPLDRLFDLASEDGDEPGLATPSPLAEEFFLLSFFFFKKFLMVVVAAAAVLLCER